MRHTPVLLAVPVSLLASVLLPPVQAMFVPSPDLLRELVAESIAKADAAPPVHLDVPYHRSAFRTHALDIYEPTVTFDHGRAPVVVFLHGGSWIQGDKVTIRVVDRFLSRMRSRGYFVIAVNYTDSLLRGFRGPVGNVRRAIRWIASRAPDYGYDPHRIGLYGVSAGGHLALMVASTMQSDACSFAFAFIECAPTDLVAMRDGDAFDSSGVFRLFPERRLKELSPIRYADDRLPPVLVYHGEEDRTVHIKQSERYVDAVRAAGGDATLVRYPEGDHAFLNLSDETWYEQETRALEFFQAHF
jgi:acetyl esterase/lipase